MTDPYEEIAKSIEDILSSLSKESQDVKRLVVSAFFYGFSTSQSIDDHISAKVFEAYDRAIYDFSDDKTREVRKSVSEAVRRECPPSEP
jgi:hypothetical protein